MTAGCFRTRKTTSVQTQTGTRVLRPGPSSFTAIQLVGINGRHNNNKFRHTATQPFSPRPKTPNQLHYFAILVKHTERLWMALVGRNASARNFPHSRVWCVYRSHVERVIPSCRSGTRLNEIFTNNHSSVSKHKSPISCLLGHAVRWTTASRDAKRKIHNFVSGCCWWPIRPGSSARIFISNPQFEFAKSMSKTPPSFMYQFN